MIDPNLKKHLDTNLLDYKELPGNLIRVDKKTLYFHNIEKPVLPDNNEFSIIFDSSLFDIVTSEDVVDYIIYKLGPWYMYTPINCISNVELRELKYIGKSVHDVYFDSFLGIHGRYERMCGVGEYSEWVQKAKFLGYTTLGICERGTLGGTLQFQTVCKKKGIKPIIGYTLPVETQEGYRIDIKLYVKSVDGWENLLLINKLLNEGNGYLPLAEVVNKSKGLVCVLEPGEGLTTNLVSLISRFYSSSYLQIGGKEYSSNLIDKNYLHSLQKYITSRWFEKLPPILIHDAYCLDKEHTHLKDLLVKQSDLGFRESTRNHYFQSSQKIILDFINLFGTKTYEDLVLKGIENLNHIRDICDFKIGSKRVALPSYEMSSEQKEKFKSNEELFYHIINEGIEKKIRKNKSVALERVEKELKVITQGFVDYFLILWDILRWCREENIQYGPGRGSAAGSLVSYLMSITKVNPLDFDLLFEIFLNEARLGKIKREEVVIVELEDNIDVELSLEEEITIFRDGEQITIKANELKRTDRFIKSTNLDTREV